MDFAEVGVKALDEYTLEYTLEKPVPYFLSSLTYVCYMPVYGPFLEEMGSSFGAATGPDTLLYCGAYILSRVLPPADPRLHQERELLGRRPGLHRPDRGDL